MPRIGKWGAIREVPMALACRSQGSSRIRPTTFFKVSTQQYVPASLKQMKQSEFRDEVI